MKYRRHAGGFKESLESLVEINTLEELIIEIENWWGEQGKIIKVEFTDYIFDNREGWNDDSYYVLVTFENCVHPVVTGMSNNILDL